MSDDKDDDFPVTDDDVLVTKETLQDPAFLNSIIGLLILRMNPTGRSVQFPRKLIAMLNNCEIATMVMEDGTLLMSVLTPEEAQQVRAAGFGGAFPPSDPKTWN